MSTLWWDYARNAAALFAVQPGVTSGAVKRGSRQSSGKCVCIVWTTPREFYISYQRLKHTY